MPTPAVEGLEFRQVAPLLAALYRDGLLTPFVGSGMSLGAPGQPACTSWRTFLVRLAAGAGLPDVPPDFLDPGRPPTPEQCYRLADKVTMVLRARPPGVRDEVFRQALKEAPEFIAPTPQLRALTRLYWPLVLTTNYDDLYWAARQATLRAEGHPSEPLAVLGRSLPDCHRVLRSLSEPSRPVLWALQGYLGGQCAPPEASVPSDARRRTLALEVVAGHQQYQRAIHAVPHFRRAFGEVFRRRSLLFLGSGLLENYLVDLFSEILYHQGPGQMPHFALLRRTGAPDLYDPAFLQTRLGVVPVFYDRHDEVPAFLEDLARDVRWPRDQPPPPASFAQVEELRYTLQPPPADHAVRLVLRRGRVSPGQVDWAAGDALVLSAGRREGRPVLGNQALALDALAPCPGVSLPPEPGEWEATGTGHQVFQYGDAALFAVVARTSDEGRNDRDLSVIAPAVCTALAAVEQTGRHGRVHILPVAAGRSAHWNPIHPFAQVLRGVRLFVTGVPVRTLREIILYIDHPGVWHPLMAGKLPVTALLSSDIQQYTVDLRDAAGESEVLSVTSPDATSTVVRLLATCGLTNPGEWDIQLDPPLAAALPVTPETVVVPTMNLRLRPRRA
ncbi:SIR2 family protein [Deinococcus apachensis]|uniref:SIR2 family protein n=1 Tax=Deinococcus apachensis TaxID=309886 RepID=UPI00037B5EC7|nr:SIR2 family protein [Deinococcus apachensis]